MGQALVAPAGGRAAATFESAAGVWTLYELPTRDYEGSSPLWQPFKLMLPPETPQRWRARRSYRLTWNADSLRFRRDHDCHALELTHADLHMRVETFMSLTYDAAWLMSNLGLTPAEIEAERAKLAAAARTRRARRRGATAPPVA
jgi:hypothetical protein